MITAEQIPDEVVEKARDAMLHDDGWNPPLMTVRIALAAALAAWPDMVERFFPNDPTRASGIFLPLPQEPHDKSCTDVYFCERQR
jgi:hypothetical protein